MDDKTEDKHNINSSILLYFRYRSYHTLLIPAISNILNFVSPDNPCK